MLQDILNELSRNADKMAEQNKLIEQENINFRTFAPRKNPMPSPSKIPAPNN